MKVASYYLFMLNVFKIGGGRDHAVTFDSRHLLKRIVA